MQWLDKSVAARAEATVMGKSDLEVRGMCLGDLQSAPSRRFDEGWLGRRHKHRAGEPLWPAVIEGLGSMS